MKSELPDGGVYLPTESHSPQTVQKGRMNRAELVEQRRREQRASTFEKLRRHSHLPFIKSLAHHRMQLRFQAGGAVADATRRQGHRKRK